MKKLMLVSLAALVCLGATASTAGAAKFKPHPLSWFKAAT